jgi:hypothetical protein
MERARLQVALDRDGAPEVRHMVGAELPTACQRSAAGALCHIRLFHISDDGLPTFIDMDVFNANELRASLAKPS